MGGWFISFRFSIKNNPRCLFPYDILVFIYRPSLAQSLRSFTAQRLGTRKFLIRPLLSLWRSFLVKFFYFLSLLIFPFFVKLGFWIPLNLTSYRVYCITIKGHCRLNFQFMKRFRFRFIYCYKLQKLDLHSNSYFLIYFA